MRSLWLLILLLLHTQADAQIIERVRHMLVGDSTAAPDHDTTYVTTYRANLVLSALITYNGLNVTLTDKSGRLLTYSTNNAAQYGFGLNYKWLSAEATFGIPAWSSADPARGVTHAKGLGLGFTGRRLWIRSFWKTTDGFYLGTGAELLPGRDPATALPVRPDLHSLTWTASVNYALSRKRRFSQNAALFQMERQKRSAGTWVAGASLWYSRLEGDSSLVPRALANTFIGQATFDRARRVIIGATFGYTHSFVLGHKGFIHMAFIPGLAYQQQLITSTEVDLHLHAGSVGSVLELKLGAGYNGDRFYSALTSALYINNGDVNESVNLGATYYFVRFAVGMRFRPLHSRALAKWGL